VIVSADGTDVTGIEQLATYLDQNKNAGDTVQLSIVRDGKSMNITATLANWPAA
jgi:S1-C subfamily serine protease